MDYNVNVRRDTMRKRLKHITTFILMFSMIIGVFSMSGCTSGGDAYADNVPKNLLNALNRLDYSAYLDLLYPPLRAGVEKEREELGLSKEEYMQHLRDENLPFEDKTTRIDHASSITKKKPTTMDDFSLELLIDRYIYYDDYETIDSALVYDYIIRDSHFQNDAEATAFYEMQITVVLSNTNYYLASFSISQTPYEESSTGEGETTTEANQDTTAAN